MASSVESCSDEFRWAQKTGRKNRKKTPTTLPTLRGRSWRLPPHPPILSSPLLYTIHLQRYLRPFTPPFASPLDRLSAANEPAALAFSRFTTAQSVAILLQTHAFPRPSRPFSFHDFLTRPSPNSSANIMSDTEKKVRVSGEQPRPAEPVLPTVNPSAEKSEPPKAPLHPAVYVVYVCSLHCCARSDIFPGHGSVSVAASFSSTSGCLTHWASVRISLTSLVSLV